MLLAALTVCCVVFGQQPAKPKPLSDEELTAKITALDAEFFGAYNSCDLDKFGSFISDSLEFYHDQSGMMTSKQQMNDALKNNICGKVRRELVAGSMKVYPMHGYGALQIGTHRFYQGSGAVKDTLTGIAQFVHLWQFQDGAWKVTRVISFDHRAASAK